MSGIPIPKDTVAQIVADWRTGNYTQRDLADKHKVSAGLVAKHTKGVLHDVSNIVSAGVQYKQGLAAHGEHGAHVARAIEQVVDERTQDLIFIRNASLVVAQKAVTKVETEDCTMQDLRHAQEVIGKGKENIYGKQPDSLIQVNNNNARTLNDFYGDANS